MPEELRFRFSIESFDEGDFEVERFSGREALNELYHFDLHVRCHFEEDHVTTALGKTTHFEWADDHDTRVIHGVITSLRFIGQRQAHGRSVMRYVMRLAPRAWLMSLHKNSRIFQGKRVDEVVREVLALHGIPSRWLFAANHPPRAYCTQYEETDLAFITRLVAEEGLHFHFEQPQDEASAAASAIGQLADAAVATIGSAVAGGDPTANLPSLGAGLFGWLGGLREVMVFSDHSAFYPVVPEEGGLDWTQQFAQLARNLGTQAIGAAGTQATGMLSQVSEPLGEVGGELIEAGISALGQELAAMSSRELTFRPRTGMIAEHSDVVTELRKQRQLHSLSATYSVYDPERPQAKLVATKRDEGELSDLLGDLLDGTFDPSKLAQLGLEQATSLAGGVGGTGGQALAQGFERVSQRAGLGPHGSGAEIYQHQGHYLHPDWDHERSEPKRILAAAKRRAAVAEGKSLCPWLSAGHRFHLREHPLPSLGAEQVVVAVRHETTGAGEDTQQGYLNHFECVAADVHYVPPRPNRRFVQVCQTATVVGASEIDTDSRGQVCVRFHWDRRGLKPTHTTCRIRTMQVWANAGHGTQFIPRVGSEVVVGFDGGDPDRPLVLGSVYNAISPPPFALPQRAAVSGIVTQSTPGGDGSNELSFDDTAGAEVVKLAAQRDLQLRAGRERQLEVHGDDRQTVRGGRSVEVGGLLVENLRQGRELNIESSDNTAINGDSIRSTTGSSSERVEGSRSVEVAGSSRSFVRGGVNDEVTGNVVQRVAGNFARIVGGGGGGRSYATRVEGDFKLAASQQGALVADQGLVIQCGNSAIHLAPDQIYITAPDILLESASSRLHLGRSDAFLTSDGQIVIKGQEVVTSGSGASVGLTTEAAIEGAQILLNSPSSAEAPAEDRSNEPTTIVLKDQRGEPIPNHPYRIIKADESEITGTVDAQGRATVDLDEDAHIIFPGLRNPRGDQ